MQQRFKQHTALMLGAAGVVLVLAGGFFLLRGTRDPQADRAKLSDARQLSSTTAPAPTSTGPRKPPQGWDNILHQIRSPDPAERQAGIDSLRNTADTVPTVLADQMQHWIKPLVEAQLWPQILTLTEIAIPLHPDQTNVVADQQLARAQAMLALGRHREALAEAKSAFNVMPQKLVGRAIDTLAQTLTEQPGSAEALLVQRFRQYQVTASNPNFKPASTLELVEAPDNVLANVRVDPAVYEKGLARLASDTSYDGLMGRGNLLLLADRPEEAMQVFLQAAAEPGLKGKKLWGPLEGVIRARRAKAGGIGPGNAAILAMKFGATASSYLSEISTLELPIDQLHDAGRGIPLATLPDSLQAEAKSAGIDAGKLDLLGRMDHVIALVRDASPSDPDLIAWLTRFEEAPAISSQLAPNLRELLEKTPLDVLTLFQLAQAFYAATGDDSSGALFYGIAARRARVMLQQGDAKTSLPVVRAINEQRQSYKEVLWARIHKADKDAIGTLAELYSAFVATCPPNEPEMVKELPTVMVGLAECLCLLGRHPEAEVVLSKVDPQRLVGQQVLSYHWAYVLALDHSGRHDDAIPHLQACAESEAFSQARSAMTTLFLHLMRQNRPSEARSWYERYRERYGDDRTTVHMKARLEALDLYEESLSEVLGK